MYLGKPVAPTELLPCEQGSGEAEYCFTPVCPCVSVCVSVSQSASLRKTDKTTDQKLISW